MKNSNKLIKQEKKILLEKGVEMVLKQFEDNTFSIVFNLSPEKEKKLEKEIKLKAGSII